ncbi:hypothetical protein BY996DRAFT_6414521 [Phakopsora pachyrhizi]|nr:hypothetical protein BY996DRAFT_6414521 [Phakopsora pachyrhizi]
MDGHQSQNFDSNNQFKQQLPIPSAIDLQPISNQNLTNNVGGELGRLGVMMTDRCLRDGDGTEIGSGSGSGSGHTSYLPDLTRRKEWEKRLVDDLEDLIQIIKSDGTIQFISKSFRRLLSPSQSRTSTYSQEMMIVGKSIYDKLCFDGLDAQNLRNQIRIISSEPSTTLHCFLRFKKLDSMVGFVILEMTGHLVKHSTSIQDCGDELIYLSGRLHPSSFSRLEDHFLELMIENQQMTEILSSLSSNSLSPTSSNRPRNNSTSSESQNQSSSMFKRRMALERFDRQVIPSEIQNVDGELTSNHQLYNQRSSISSSNPGKSSIVIGGSEDETIKEGEMSFVRNINDDSEDYQLSAQQLNNSVSSCNESGNFNIIDNGNNFSTTGSSRKSGNSAIEFVCKECGVTDSPEWRKGPMGRKTLCNACGLRWAKRSK